MRGGESVGVGCHLALLALLCLPTLHLTSLPFPLLFSGRARTKVELVVCRVRTAVLFLTAYAVRTTQRVEPASSKRKQKKEEKKRRKTERKTGKEKKRKERRKKPTTSTLSDCLPMANRTAYTARTLHTAGRQRQGDT
ncbi:hypothetical protein LX32DRAFT_251959 [Colletotrichum zoysiae]|uniref:Uncharacterized protein n=1 Tax=Colletotrichum zoysiae TaxID=1216348 RepID=A0AAD9H529_9PEZI|nr:hypothetical protein LX32DRAFT_251959 [Colletotrichum zoysiae]